MNIHDPNVLWDLIETSASDILQKMCPIRRFKQRETLTPWMVVDIYREIRLRDRLVIIFKQARTHQSLCALRRQRTIANSKIETAKKNYIQRILNENVTNQWEFGKLINEHLNGKKFANEYAQLIDPNTNDRFPFGDEAEFLNSYFCYITDRLGLDENIVQEQYRRIESDLSDL